MYPFLISTVETLLSVLRFKKCFGTFLRFATNNESKILIDQKLTIAPEKKQQKVN